MAEVTIQIKGYLENAGLLRPVGQRIRDQIKVQWSKGIETVNLDFDDETIASGSLFDEIAKLFDEFPKDYVKSKLKFKRIDPWDERLLTHLAKLRLEKQAEMEEA